MNQGRSLPLHRDHNPLNINIEFNINGHAALPYPHLQPSRVGIRPGNPSRASEVPQTDRNTYSRDIEQPKAMETSKKKRNKRNSMDMNAVFLSKGSHLEVDRKKAHVRVQATRKQEQQTLQKKKSNTKYFVEAYKKAFLEPTSRTFESKSQRKTVQKSLKSIIHKIVYSELSKRSLAKSPYQTHNQSISNPIINRKKSSKKSEGCRSERAVEQAPQIVQKLNSLKSMTNSILQSEVEEGEMHCYSKKGQRIHIKTEHDVDFIDEIAYYQRKAARNDKKGEAVNRAALSETTRIIENYIQQFMQEQHRDTQEDREHESSSSGNEDVEQQLHFQRKKKMKEVLHNQMRQLLGNDAIRGRTVQVRQNVVEQQITEAKSPSVPVSLESQDKIRPFLSSQIGKIRPNTDRPQGSAQQVQKWGYLLDFIRKNIGSSQVDIQAVLQEVYWFLERGKSEALREGTQQKPPALDDDFTVKYSEKRERVQSDIENQDEDVASFREQYNQENEELKMLNLDTISNALQNRQQSLLRKKEQELNSLQSKRQAGRITEEQLQRQSQKVQIWTRKELSQISKAKKSIWRGYHEAKGILDKTVSSKYYEQHHASNKMMKCLSQTYLRRKHSDYVKALQTQHRDSDASGSRKSSSAKSELVESESSRQPRSSQGESVEQSNASLSEQAHSAAVAGQEQLQSPDHSEQMQAIRERLLQIKQQHLTAENKSPETISYQQVQKQLQEQYSDEQMAILNQQVGNTFANNLSASPNNKLRYMCAEDKEDIFEFIFLDLCIELYQQPCRQNKIMRQINAYVAQVQAQARKKKGVKTNLNVVKEYLKRFVSYLLRTSRQCLGVLATPMGPTALEMLRYMHEGDYQVQEEEEAPTLIVPISVFQKFQQSLLPTLEFEEYYSDPAKEQARISFLKTVLHIHNKALFDSLNEFLDHQRPFGIWGKPFPWKKSSSFPHVYDEAMLQQKLRSSMDKVIEQCSYVCGLLVDKQDSLVGNAKISEAYVEQIREDRLSRMLASELVQSEQRWLFYDDEETEVLVQVSSCIWKQLLGELDRDILSLLA